MLRALLVVLLLLLPSCRDHEGALETHDSAAFIVTSYEESGWEYLGERDVLLWFQSPPDVTGYGVTWTICRVDPVDSSLYWEEVVDAPLLPWW
mgnify:CR=1 FL=1